MTLGEATFMKKRVKQWAMVAVVSLGVSGCDRAALTAPRPSPTGSAASSAHQRPLAVGSKERRPDEDRFVLLAREEPSFAGFYIDNSGDLVVQVADETRRRSAEAVVARHRSLTTLGLPTRYRTSKIQTRKVEFDFQQLSDWRDLATDSILGRYGVVWTDLDERRNTVTLGLGAGNESAVRAILRRNGVPDRAVYVKPNSGATPLTRVVSATEHPYSVTSGVDTVGGGLQLERSGMQCTLGFTAIISSVVRPVTASHCSYTMWSTESSQQKVGNHYGIYETSDPTPSNCSAFEILFNICYTKRASDAALYTVQFDTLKYRVGLLVRLRNRNTGSGGSLLVDTIAPWIYVASSTNTPTDGAAVDKIGSYSGWTYGNVNATCVDVGHPGYRRAFCQGKAHTWAHGGDSGGPVFSWDGEDGASLYGINSALDCSSCTENEDMFFSPMSGIINDLGSMNVVSNVTVGTPSVSGTVSGGAVLSWSAVSTSNTTKTTYYKIYRSTWNATNYTWSDDNQYLGQTSSTSFTDSGPLITINSYLGAYPPNGCEYSYARYQVVAYNSGITGVASPVYFLGPADGAYPTQEQCP